MIHCVQHYSENSGQEKRTVIAVAEPAAAIAAIEMTVGSTGSPTEVTSATRKRLYKNEYIV